VLFAHRPPTSPVHRLHGAPFLGPRLFERLLVEAVDVAGSERVLFGSDQMVWPQMIPKAVRSIAGSLSLTHQEKSRVLKENAIRLLKR